MSILIKFIRLSGRNRSLLLRAAGRLWLLRLGLIILPFRLVHRLAIRKVDEPAVAAPDADDRIDRIVWAVITAGRCLVGNDLCLPQAMAASMMLQREGLPTEFRIGAQTNDKTGISAHAWLEYEGVTIIGGPDVSHYTVFQTLADRHS